MKGDRGERLSQHPVFRTLMRQSQVSAKQGFRNIGGCLLNQLKAVENPQAGMKIFQRTEIGCRLRDGREFAFKTEISNLSEHDHIDADC